ncbi:Blp family class II bacteriocin [Pseudolactococcus yaeyamensis]
MTNKTLNNVAGLNNFSTLTEDEMMMVEGGGTATDLGKATIAGATVGASIGSIVPGLGTGFGAILGAKFGLAVYSIARYGF